MAGLSLLPEQIAHEREIVKEERRGRTDNDVDGQLDEKLWATAFTRSSVRWPVLGSMADIDRIAHDDMAAYFATHYGPNACVLVLTGDFATRDALQRLTRAFAHVPRSVLAADSIVDGLSAEPPQTHERRVRMTYPGDAASVSIGYRAPGARDADTSALEVLATVLGGSSAARLPQALVRARGIALDTDARYDAHLAPTLFEISAGFAPGVRVARGIAAIDSVIARLALDGPTPREVRTAAAQLALGLVHALATNNTVGEQIGFAETIRGDYRWLYEAIPRWNAVTVEDVQRVARAYLIPARRTVAELVPAISANRR